MSDYWLGVLTVPTTVTVAALVCWLVWGLTHRWKYLSKSCGVRTCKAQWLRDEHPKRPWWLWEIRVGAHGKTDRAHRAFVKQWRADHCARTWYGTWRYVR